MCGWSESCDNTSLIVSLFWRVYRHLELSWTSGYPSHRSSVLGVWVPGEPDSFRVTDTAVFKDKLYLGLSCCRVQVYDINSLLQINTLETTGAEAESQDLELDRRSCKLAQYDRTLAVTNVSRTKVRLYNCDTDDMVGEIETRAGHIYNLVINDRLLVCLSGWSLLSWRVDSARPDTVRGRFMGVCPDFEPSDQYQNWLEIHSAAINSDYLVTRATRTLVNPAPANVSQTRSRIFLHVRRIGPDGFIGNLLRPNDTALDFNVVELNSMKLSESNLLATMVMMRHESSDLSVGAGGAGVYYLRYVIQVTNIVTGEMIASMPTQSILSSVQIPVCWRGDTLYVKIVPKPVGGFYSTDSDDEEDVYEVSLASWNYLNNQLTNIPSVQVDEGNVISEVILFLIQVSSSSDFMNIEAARLAVISTKFSHRPFVGIMDQEDMENLDHNAQEPMPRFTVKASTYDFWNLVET